MEYIVKTISAKEEIDFVPKANIDIYKWGKEYTPEAFAQLAILKDKGFYFKLTCFESDPKAVYFNYGDNVYFDSCIEMFISFNPASKLFTNMEMNANGALLMGIEERRGEGRRASELITPPTITAKRLDDRWSVEGLLSFADIDTLFGKCTFESGTVLKGNFYKCGDQTAVVHFGTWAPVDLPQADFHRSEFFGDIIIE